MALEERTEPAQRRASWWRRLTIAAGLALAGAVLVVTLYRTAPRGDTGDAPVDVLLVLGTPAGMHGELTEMQRWRVDEAVREYRRGRAPRLLISGGRTFRGFVEADVMGRYAVESGVPANDVYRERSAMTTLENIRDSAVLMQSHGWSSVEVISTKEHLPRAAVFLAKTGLHWRLHAAPTPDRGWADVAIAYTEEAVGTAALRVFGPRSEPVLHLLARGQHGLAWCVRWVLYRVQDWLREFSRK